MVISRDAAERAHLSPSRRLRRRLPKYVRDQLEEIVSRLLVTLLATLTIVAMPLSSGVAAKTFDLCQLAHRSVSVTSGGFFAIKGGL